MAKSVVSSSVGSLVSHQRRTGGVTRGTTNDKVLIFSTSESEIGSDITYNNSSADGDSFVINKSGIYMCNLNVYQPSGSGGSIQIRTGLAIENTLGGTQSSIRSYVNTDTGFTRSAGSSFYCDAGDLIWFIFDGGITASLPYLNQMSITRVG